MTFRRPFLRAFCRVGLNCSVLCRLSKSRSLDLAKKGLFVLLASPKRAYSLDMMRGLAAISVVLYHSSTIIPDLASAGYLAVDFFFCLSGYVVAMAYTHRLDAGLTVVRFAKLRILRLYPLYLIGVLLGLARLLYGIKQGSELGVVKLFGIVITSLTMLPFPSAGELYPANFPAWSLLFEIAINILYAVILRTLSNRALAGVMVVAAAAMFLFSGLHGSLDMGATWGTFGGGTARIFFAFNAGILIWRLSSGGRGVVSWKFVIPVAVLLTCLLAPRHGGASNTLDTVLAITVFPVLVWFGARYEPPRFLTAASGWLGDISYPLYAVHAAGLFIGLFFARKLYLPNQISLILIVSGLIVLATFLERYFDAPIRRKLGRRLHVPASATPTVL